MKKLGIIFILSFFILALFSVPILSALNETEEYSIYENRKLASFPQYSAELLFNGHYSRAWENYLSDHIIGRNMMLSVYTRLELDILKKGEVNDVVVSGDILLPFIAYGGFDAQEIYQKAQAMAQELSALDAHIRENGGEFLYVAIPEQRSALSSYYPWYMNSDLDRLNCISDNFFSALKEKGVSYLDMKVKFGENIGDYYSKLDHHYTYKGAYYTYKCIMDELGLEPATVNIKELPNPFYGSRNRKLYNNFPTDEKFMIGESDAYIPFTRTDNGKEVSPTLFAYFNEDTESPITYTAYMGGDVAETVIDTDRPNLPDILVFGDSFTNPLESMLYLNANKLYSIDLRHYSEKTLFEYIAETKPDIVLCVRDDTNFLVTEGNGTFR